MGTQDRKQQDKQASVLHAGLSGANSEVVQRYGSAVKEHFVAYTGVDQETGQKLAKGLKEISQYKVNPDYFDANIRQQAGFSAEVKTSAIEKAEQIIRGDSARSVRTDDMVKQSDGRGHTIGGKNEQLYDIAQVDSYGGYIEGTGRQLKYVGGDPKSCAEKLLSKGFDKYRDADVPVEIPSDFFEEVNSELKQKCSELEEQIKRAEQNGKNEVAEKHKQRLKKVEKTRKNLRKGKQTSEEAVQARLHPERSVVKDIAKISHRAGLESAKTGVAIGGGISLIQNSVAVIKGDKEPAKAIIDVAGDVTKSGVLSYATGYVGSAVKGAMQNAPSKYLQTLSKTNLPATLVVSALEVGKTLSKFGCGEIDGTDCLTELGEKGTGMLASSVGATIGQFLIPVPIVGGLVGSMIGYAMSTAYYNNLVSVLNEAKFAHEERLIIEAECEASIAAMREYRLQIELATYNYLRENISVFQTAFMEMEEAYQTGNADMFIHGSNSITRQLGGIPLFETKDQFDALMKSTITIEL